MSTRRTRRCAWGKQCIRSAIRHRRHRYRRGATPPRSPGSTLVAKQAALPGCRRSGYGLVRPGWRELRIRPPDCGGASPSARSGRCCTPQPSRRSRAVWRLRDAPRPTKPCSPPPKTSAPPSGRRRAWRSGASAMAESSGSSPDPLSRRRLVQRPRQQENDIVVHVGTLRATSPLSRDVHAASIGRARGPARCDASEHTVRVVGMQ
jgi:hypothetical protein